MKPQITVSINPTYLCNFRCDFCYLTEDQLRDNDRVTLLRIYDRLEEISKHAVITHVDIYGGEVTLLPEAYMEEVIDMAHHFGTGRVNIITNLSRIPGWLYRDDIDISVSWDYHARQDHMKVYNNMLAAPSDVHVLMLASYNMINWADEDIIMADLMLSQLARVQSVEIKPYSTNQANADLVSFADFEEFVQRWLTLTTDRNYEFVNEKNIQESLMGVRNAWSDDHIYITPNGKFGVLEFDLLDNEYFKELDSFDEYLEWAVNEKKKIGENKYCSACEYFGHCLSEHLREVRSLENSCNGFVNLLDWYAERSQT